MAIIVQSVDRALGILFLFGSTGTFLGVSEIAAVMKLDKGAVWGLTTTLKQDRFLRQDYLSTNNMQVGSPLWSRPPVGKPPPPAVTA